ncbi:MAG: hypothetical protein EOO24_17490, partial [Comamonadaceae bacterium]
MVAEVKMLRAHTGLRGRPAADLEALAHAISALSTLALHAPTVREAEVNPLLLRQDGVLAVDALVYAA